MPDRQQSAMEFMITYAWAFIIIALFIVSVILISGIKPPTAYLQSTCTIQPLIPCTETLLTYNSTGFFNYYLVFTNQLGPVIEFPDNALNITQSVLNSGNGAYATGSCVPANAPDSAVVFCTASIPTGKISAAVGDQVIINFAISYNICSITNGKSSCAPGLYKSSGYSVQDIAPLGVKLDYLTMDANLNGLIVLNGVSYFPGSSTYLPSGNYIIYAQPAQGSTFSSWSITSSGSTIAAPDNQNTTLSLNSNAVVAATFT